MASTDGNDDDDFDNDNVDDGDGEDDDNDDDNDDNDDLGRLWLMRVQCQLLLRPSPPKACSNICYLSKYDFGNWKFFHQSLSKHLLSVEIWFGELEDFHHSLSKYDFGCN